jgi:hypothetical protein
LANGFIQVSFPSKGLEKFVCSTVDSLLKKGTGSEPAIVSAAKNGGREVPVPFFNRQLA